MSERFSDEVLLKAAEDLWEQIGVGCLCQQAEVPHWCEDCQVTLGIIRAAMRAVLEGHLADRCDNKLTRKVDGKMTDYVCGLPRDHEGSCLWRQVASDGSPR